MQEQMSVSSCYWALVGPYVRNPMRAFKALFYSILLSVVGYFALQTGTTAWKISFVLSLVLLMISYHQADDVTERMEDRAPTSLERGVGILILPLAAMSFVFQLLIGEFAVYLILGGLFYMISGLF